jgi:hypothetical protein
MKQLRSFLVNYPFLCTLLLGLLFFVLPFKPKPFGDGEYHEGTIQLLDYIASGFQGAVRVDKGLVTLLYYAIPYALVHFLHLSTAYYLSGVVFNVFVTALAMHLLVRTFTHLQFDKTAQFWPMLLLCLFPIPLYYAMGILAEPAAFFAVAWFVYAWVLMVEQKDQSKMGTQLALALLLLVGTRPNLLPFAVVFVLYFWTFSTTWQLKLKCTAIVLIGFLALQSFEQSVNTESPDFKSTVFRNQLLWSRFELRDEPFNWLPQHGQDAFASSDYLNNLKKRQELESICEAQQLDKTDYFIQWVKQDILSHTLLTLRQYFFKFFQSQSFVISPLMKSDKSPMLKWGIHGYINAVNYVLVFGAMWGLWLLFKEKKYTLFFPFLFLWGWSLLYVCIFHSEQRYMFPLRAMQFFLLAYAVHQYTGRQSLQSSDAA